jgi:hypothetical protein
MGAGKPHKNRDTDKINSQLPESQLTQKSACQKWQHEPFGPFMIGLTFWIFFS